jgi:hypothetical protein
MFWERCTGKRINRPADFDFDVGFMPGILILILIFQFGVKPDGRKDSSPGVQPLLIDFDFDVDVDFDVGRFTPILGFTPIWKNRYRDSLRIGKSKSTATLGQNQNQNQNQKEDFFEAIKIKIKIKIARQNKQRETAMKTEHEAAVRLADRIKSGMVSSPFTNKSVYDKGWHGLKDKQEVESACNVLIDENWLMMRRKPKPATGRPPAPEYYINPFFL